MAQDFEMKESKCVNRTACHSACTDGHIESAHHIALIPCTTSGAQGKIGCVPKKNLRLLRSVSRHAQYTQHSVLYISHLHWSTQVDHIQNPLRSSMRSHR